jgi:hypothetical protein
VDIYSQEEPSEHFTSKSLSNMYSENPLGISERSYNDFINRDVPILNPKSFVETNPYSEGHN